MNRQKIERESAIEEKTQQHIAIVNGFGIIVTHGYTTNDDGDATRQSFTFIHWKSQNQISVICCSFPLKNCHFIQIVRWCHAHCIPTTHSLGCSVCVCLSLHNRKFLLLPWRELFIFHLSKLLNVCATPLLPQKFYAFPYNKTCDRSLNHRHKFSVCLHRFPTIMWLIFSLSISLSFLCRSLPLSKERIPSLFKHISPNLNTFFSVFAWE